LLFSCGEHEDFNIRKSEEIFSDSKINDLQLSFGMALSRALKDYPELRTIIKNESLKKFNNDNDVLYQMIKENVVASGFSMHDILSQYFENESKLEQIEENLPLLTIFVPTLPDFSPETWNAETEIPQIAVVLKGKSNVSIFDSDGSETLLSPDLIPGFPVLVIKQNERVIAHNSGSYSKNRVANSALSFFKNQDFEFEFEDEIFDGINNSGSNNNKRTIPTFVLPGQSQTIILDAYNSGTAVHRDYIYYGITPTSSSGTYRNNYSEYIRGFEFVNANGLPSIANAVGDPQPNEYIVPNHPPYWTDGVFEFRVIILINARNGAGQTLLKRFNANGSDLFTIKYKRYILNIYKIESITPKLYNPNIELVPWNLEDYSTGWKFMVWEEDDEQTETYKETHTSKFVTNFTIGSGGEKKKTKWELGVGYEVTNSQEHTISIKKTSDELGEAILTYDQPIIIDQYWENYVLWTRTNEISTGLVKLSIESVQKF